MFLTDITQRLFFTVKNDSKCSVETVQMKISCGVKAFFCAGSQATNTGLRNICYVSYTLE